MSIIEAGFQNQNKGHHPAARTPARDRDETERFDRPADAFHSGQEYTPKEPNLDTLDYVHHASFNLPHSEEQLWGEDRKQIEIDEYDLLPSVEQGVGSSSPKRSSLSKDDEKTLFLRYNYAKYRVIRIRDEKDDGDETDIRRWRDRAQSVRRKIVHANLPLVPAMANRTKAPRVEFTEMISEGYMAVLRSVEKFDVSRGYKFSTYACRAILSSFYRLGSKNKTYRKHVPVQFDIPIEQSDFVDRRHCEQLSHVKDVLQDVIRSDAAELSDMEFRVIQERYPAYEVERKPTFVKTAKRLGISSERVRQLEKRSLNKLYDAMQERLY